MIMALAPNLFVLPFLQKQIPAATRHPMCPMDQAVTAIAVTTMAGAGEA